MKGYHSSIEQLTSENTLFRKVLYTSGQIQLVLMAIPPMEEIGFEIHSENDQFFRFESGTGRCIIDGNEYPLKDGDAVIVPRGAKHNILNTSKTEFLKLYTIYSPPHHKDGVQFATKALAEASDEEFDGKTTEG